MYFSSLLLHIALVPFTLGQANENTAATNGLGSSPADRHYITIAQMRSVIAAGSERANSTVPSSIAVVDPSGQLVGFERGDNAFLASADLAIKKARTVVLFKSQCDADLLYSLFSEPEHHRHRRTGQWTMRHLLYSTTSALPSDTQCDHQRSFYDLHGGLAT